MPLFSDLTIPELEELITIDVPYPGEYTDDLGRIFGAQLQWLTAYSNLMVLTHPLGQFPTVYRLRNHYGVASVRIDTRLSEALTDTRLHVLQWDGIYLREIAYNDSANPSDIRAMIELSIHMPEYIVIVSRSSGATSQYNLRVEQVMGCPITIYPEYPDEPCQRPAQVAQGWGLHWGYSWGVARYADWYRKCCPGTAGWGWLWGYDWGLGASLPCPYPQDENDQDAVQKRLMNRMHRVLRTSPAPKLNALLHGLAAPLVRFGGGQAGRQLYLDTASGAWLDDWGEMFAVPRFANERDTDYRLRIKRLALRGGISTLADIEERTVAALGIEISAFEEPPVEYQLDVNNIRSSLANYQLTSAQINSPTSFGLRLTPLASDYRVEVNADFNVTTARLLKDFLASRIPPGAVANSVWRDGTQMMLADAPVLQTVTINGFGGKVYGQGTSYGSHLPVFYPHSA
jgi:hypothetical protein